MAYLWFSQKIKQLVIRKGKLVIFPLHCPERLMQIVVRNNYTGWSVNLKKRISLLGGQEHKSWKTLNDLCDSPISLHNSFWLLLFSLN